MKLHKFFISVLLATLALLYGGSCMAAKAESDQREYKLKAAFLLNFSKFTTWPKEAFTSKEQTFDFCIVGEDPFGATLEGLQAKQVGGRQVSLHYAKTIAEVQSLSCQVLFVGKSEQHHLEQVFRYTDGQPVVTVSDVQGFSNRGGMFEFITKKGRLSFIVNNKQVIKNGLQVNASLLNLAAEVL